MAWKDRIKALLRRVKKRWIIAACLLALIRILMLEPIWCEWYARHIYPILMNTFTARESDHTAKTFLVIISLCG